MPGRHLKTVELAEELLKVPLDILATDPRSAALGKDPIGTLNRISFALSYTFLDEEDDLRNKDRELITPEFRELLEVSEINEFDVLTSVSLTKTDMSTTNVEPSFVLSNIGVVDADSLSWENIQEVREDADSRRKLARLRTFFYEEFDGKPIEFIEDRFGQMLEEYEVAAKKHGIERRNAVLTTITSEKHPL